jgi:FSR family fosmidomycin resistance protein-like MFS transporter
MKKNNKFNISVVILAALLVGHFTVDWYSGILKPLLPIIMNKFSLTEGQTALIPSVLGIITAFIQPLGAYFGEILSEKIIVIISLVITVLFIPLIGIAESFFLFLVFLTVGMLGNSFFHPNAASIVGKIGFKKPHTAMSVFSIGGTIGSGVAPVMILLFVKKFGFRKMPVLSIAGFVIVGFIVFSLILYKPKRLAHNFSNLNPFLALKENGTKELLVVNTLRSLAIMGFSTLIPLYVVALKFPVIWVGYFLTASRFTGAFGTYIGAVLSDRFGPKFVNIISLSIGSVFGVFVLLTKNVYVMFIAFSIAFFFWFFTMGSNVTYMQALLPRKKAIASSLGMGVSWGSASILLTLFSLFIDKIGLFPVFVLVFLSAPIALILSFKLVDA